MQSRAKTRWTWSHNAHASVWIHILFWSVTFVFFVLYFGREADGYHQSVLFVALLLPVAMATTYFATNFLVPRFLLHGRFALFALYALYALIGSIYLELVVLIVSFTLLASFDMSAMSPPTLDVFGLVVALYVVVFLAVAADLAMRWHRLHTEHDATERARLEAELALKQAELARLRTQMQPHFLFNTLNNLYGLTLERSDDAPEVVLRISAMLDYVLYGCEHPLVPLHGEIEHLETYLDLERLRYDERLEVRLCVDDDLPDGCVAPLLLTPFVENSFKHGVARTTGATWIAIQLHTSDGELHFHVENRKPDGSGARDRANTGKSFGIGLENVQQRLQLLYPGAHLLEIEDEDDRYAVHLRIPIHPCPETVELEAAV